MSPRPAISQQAIAGLAVVLVIVATLLGGLILALGEWPAPGNEAAEVQPTSTPIRLVTIAPTGAPPTFTPRLPRPSIRPQDVVLLPSPRGVGVMAVTSM
jgi:hypothetical protein